MAISRRDLFKSAAAASLQADAPAEQPVDFRYAPKDGQAAYCFPDDPYKSLISRSGELRYGHPGKGNPDFFALTVSFELNGMGPAERVQQRMEAPGVPIVHTEVEKNGARLSLVTFATRRAGEGRVDNVLITIPAGAAASIVVRTRQPLTKDGTKILAGGKMLMVSDTPLRVRDDGTAWVLSTAYTGKQTEIFLRFPQEGAPAAAEPQALLAEARAYWNGWQALAGGVQMSYPRPYQEFLTACTRNILQAREVRNGSLTFQVGPTCYRGLWVVDGNFILEAARYLGYDADVLRGLHTTWEYQRPDGALDAGGGSEHYKDSGIAIFTTVRQCELGQEWSDFDALRPKMVRAVEFLRATREKGLQEDSPAGRAGVFPRGFSDGGIGKASEFTNALWNCAGLQAAAPRLPEAQSLYAELRKSLDAASKQQMTRHAQGFEYLPMVFREDPLWQDPDPNKRPQPQSAQWALSQAIFPGTLYTREDPVVRGHVRLMQSCTQEDVPIETGWIHVGGLWTYNAAFAAHAYLWAGERDSAGQSFRGFLNHATPLWCWREEQPLSKAVNAGYIGDMPHNWASAECVLYLRHMMALEDGDTLRLLDGVGAEDLAYGEPFVLKNSPTRFGRLDLTLEPVGGKWKLNYELRGGPKPRRVVVNERVPLVSMPSSAQKG